MGAQPCLCVQTNPHHILTALQLLSLTHHLHDNNLSAAFNLSRSRREWKWTTETKKQSSNFLSSQMFVIDMWRLEKQIAFNPNKGLVWATHSKETLGTKHNWTIKVETLDTLSMLYVIYNRIVSVQMPASSWMWLNFNIQIIYSDMKDEWKQATECCFCSSDQFSYLAESPGYLALCFVLHLPPMGHIILRISIADNK